MSSRVVARFGLAVLAVLTAAPAASQEPIRVGFVTILTGPLAAPGKEMENGIELFLHGPADAEIGNQGPGLRYIECSA